MNPQKFTVRIAEPKDAEAIGQVHTFSWQTTYVDILPKTLLDSIDLEKRIQGARNRIVSPDVTCMVLVEESSQRVVGFADFGACRDKQLDADGELYGIYLLQAQQGKGGGKLLFRECVRSLREKGFKKMSLSVFEDNHESRKFYEKMGGRHLNGDHIDIGGVRYPTATYLWDLIDPDNNEEYPMRKMSISLWFDTQAEEAAKFYIDTFKNGKIKSISRYGKAGFEHHGRPEGSVMSVEFEVNGENFIGINGGPLFKFTEAISLMVYCESQQEIDDYWSKLTSDGGQEVQCGWCKDKYGLSWQITPTVLQKMMSTGDKAANERVVAAYMKMKKFDIAALERAFAGK